MGAPRGRDTERPHHHRTQHGLGPPRADGGVAPAAAAAAVLSHHRCPSAPRPALGPLTHLRGYLGHVGKAAENLLERLSLPAAQQRIRVAYEQGSAAVVTYTGILTDQLYHWWQGEQ
ncbi:apolipoprotein C-II [Myiozetetes cayanensis]|uniref:apolipoprotein C-II n=1 Tax=Myiozetetes cayanensis TaxID=478635 RepID=UPI00216003E4|nr:apolipoprotein C-II [Myiozetetes cayanensis]